MHVKLLHSGKTVEVKEVGSFNPKPYVREKLEVGETGYITANIKSPKDVKMGDTITDAKNPSPVLAGFKEIHPMVFSGIYPINTADYEHLKANLGKLQLNDSAFVYQAETFSGAGIWFSVRFPGPAAFGNRAGTAAARVRDGHYCHLSERGLSHQNDGGDDEGSGQPGIHAGSQLY